MKPRIPASKYKTFIEFFKFLKSKNALSFFKMAKVSTFQAHECRWPYIAFIWFDSTEGHEFWRDIAREWNSKLKGEQNK